MNITLIIIIVVAICGLMWVYPKLPQPGQIIVAIIVVIACLLVLLRGAGVPISL